MDSAAETVVKNEMACKSCGATLTFKPGTLKLVCQYCNAENEIVQEANLEIIENNLEEFLAKHSETQEKIVVNTIKCETCGATSTINPKLTSDKCPFCSTTFILNKGSASSVYKPQYLLPFGIDARKAMENFRTWLQRLWFAPSELKHYADRADRLNGMYLPYWTFDCQTESSYTGQKGIDFRETETYTDSQGKTQRRTVTRTEWYPASGHVSNTFDDILIEASTSLPKARLRALEPWDLKNVVKYNDQYLSGFRTENYQVDLPNAYQDGKKRMHEEILTTIRRDIGGDRQRVDSVNTTYNNPTFKYILLPVWISAYKYKEKIYQFVINARTGEVQGERPYSAFKIALAVIGGLIVAGVIYYLTQQQQN
ncbi:MAG TPA: hypothetical protein VG737_03670 [Cyclobacteriaceae bacterium]|nr:hypothetical protein [Cyclobacteriaceae bacterium]